MRFFALAALASSAIAVQTRVEDKWCSVPYLLDMIIPKLDYNLDNVISLADAHILELPSSPFKMFRATDAKRSPIHDMAKKMYPTEYKADKFNPEQMRNILQKIIDIYCKK